MSLEFHGFSGRFSSVTSPRDHVAGDAAQTMSNARADADECAKDEFNMLEDLLDESDGEDEALDRKRLGAAEGSSLRVAGSQIVIVAAAGRKNSAGTFQKKF
ncbi:hypothetical protein GUITHDRAFT_118331 [Guillardia theta CCMP2712]|uniref:Uncharacterized protein n=1 Tax=Guillardia theta (strain CCMP2712) TaxID=905079 RepID=L1IHF1_GUITC|nr:hypothetical protein GUITHDRAFT_118331 [Guillardia theta CCMP2712]EKX35522.1 hypothetical protein GUITHDRAFT_118331 [Guillardia theta CCMP2712]|eukprot:XP_005822502.1 hypothetical protein GUITHDRAFT_118331 [Guillardia theta CCMP2712]